MRFFSSDRFEALDALRGIAILWVVLFHYLVRWSDLIHYNFDFKSNIILNSGYLGVYLFFLISGFVIFLTLEKCDGFLNFLQKRWLRLFPAMFIVSGIVYLSSYFFYERPQGNVSIINLIPGLIFVEPYIIEKITGISTGILEGAFWSIFIEFKFYIIAGLIYFLVGTKKTIVTIGSLYTLWLITFYINKHFPEDQITSIAFIYSSLSFIGAQYYGWFTAGAIFYCLSQNLTTGLLIYLKIMIILILVESHYSITPNILGVSFTILIFAMTCFSKFIQNLISNSFLLLVGFISYPLYLIHENLGIAIVRKLYSFYSSIYVEIYTLVSLLFIFAMSYIIARYLEPKLRNMLKYYIHKYSRCYSIK